MPALNRMLYLEGKFFLTDHNLNYVDKVSMASGVEVRVPLLDPDLMALAARLPRLDIRLDGARLRVHTDGYVETLIDLDELIDIAATIAARCPGGRGG